LTGETQQRSLFGSAGFNSIFALVFGIIGMAGEYKQGTITPTFLASPRRWRVVLAKAVAYGLAGFLLGVVSTALVAAISYAGLAIKDIDVVMPASEVFALLGGGTAAATFYGVLGVAIGAVIPNQIAALIAVLSGSPNLGATLSLWAAAGVLAAWCVALLTMGSVVTESKDIT
jgi:ABC-type transport system involved in multi-copper enzyme maturation permease subunit